MSYHRRYIGKKQTPEYVIWHKMLARCLDRSHPAYADYGGRGITVCSRWMSFDNFVEDLGRKPFADATIERKNVDEGYHPENVEWLPRRLQNRNKRNTLWVIHNGQRKCLKQVAEDEGVSYNRLWKRTQQQGLSVTEALARAT